MALTSLLGSLLFPFRPGPLTPRPLLVAHRIVAAARDLSVHLVERARNVFRDVRDFYVAEDVLEFRGNAVAPGNGLTERNCFANHLEIGAAGSAELQIRSRFRSALRTKHDRSPFRGALSGRFRREQSNINYAGRVRMVQPKARDFHRGRVA